MRVKGRWPVISKMRRRKLMQVQRQLRRAQWRARLELASLRVAKNSARRSRRLSAP